MCTALSYSRKDHYFGRNLDLNISYGEGILITTRNYPFKFKHLEENKGHEAIIGMGIVVDNIPLYFDGANESGLSMAGLNFPHSYKAFSPKEGKTNITSYEIIPYILFNAGNINEAKAILKGVVITDESFSPQLKASPLHWIISDKNTSIVVESTENGLNIYDNPFGVLTNEPEFPIHLFNLKNYAYLSARNPKNNLSKNIEEQNYCLGLGSYGLPGDYSSPSRFIKTVFLKENSNTGDSEKENVPQFFHILESVFFVSGCALSEDDTNEITLYSSCINTDKGIYYYKTYNNSRITAIARDNENLDSDKLIFYKLVKEQDILMQN